MTMMFGLLFGCSLAQLLVPAAAASTAKGSVLDVIVFIA
jgi:hypothetical protein